VPETDRNAILLRLGLYVARKDRLFATDVAQVLGLDVDNLIAQAALAALAAGSPLRSAGTQERLQQYLRDVVRVLTIAQMVSGTAAKASAWFLGERLQPFGGKTAKILVIEGRADEVCRLLESYLAGPAG